MSESGFVPDRPHNGLPLLPPRADVETRAVLKAVVEARAALAELKQAGHLVPNQTILINTIPILEARASSEIENIVTTTDRLFQYAQDESQPTDPATKEALRYRTALRSGFESLTVRPLSTRTAVEVCRTLRAVDVDVRSVPGTTLRHAGSGEVVYTPPEGEPLLRDLLANWERYLHDATDIDPIVRMAIGHYQFEAIHPFTDGNGRTGRILNLLFLVEQHLLELPVLYTSRNIITTKAQYYQLLHDVTVAGQWEPWILYMVNVLHGTALWTTAKILAMRALLEETKRHVMARTPGIYSHELVELLFEQPYCRIANVVGAGLAHRQTASNYLKQLCDIGVLREQRAGRDKLFLHPTLLTLLASDSNHFEPYA